MTTSFKVFAALHEDISAPHVWMPQRPATTRPLATLVNSSQQKKVICQILKIDRNFHDTYNASPQTLSLPTDCPVAVMSEWYRDCLGVKKEETIEIEIKPVSRCFMWFAQLRGSVSHPDHNVRLAACLAFLSVGLGVIGLALGILSLIT